MKRCYCHTCDRRFHYLGINSHRAAHRRRGEKCTITYTHGNMLTFDWRLLIRKGIDWETYDEDARVYEGDEISV